MVGQKNVSMVAIKILESFHTHLHSRCPKVQVTPEPSDKMGPIAVVGDISAHNCCDPENNGRYGEHRIKE
jgi:hypothetical protein